MADGGRSVAAEQIEYLSQESLFASSLAGPVVVVPLAIPAVVLINPMTFEDVFFLLMPDIGARRWHPLGIVRTALGVGRSCASIDHGNDLLQFAAVKPDAFAFRAYIDLDAVSFNDSQSPITYGTVHVWMYLQYGP